MNIYLILDSEFNGDLLKLSRQHCVWICNSPSNTPKIEAVWDVDEELPLSSFSLRNEPDVDIYKWIGIINEHHHEWNSITVMGVNLNRVSKSELEMWVKRKVEFEDCGIFFKIK